VSPFGEEALRDDSDAWFHDEDPLRSVRSKCEGSPASVSPFGEEALRDDSDAWFHDDDRFRCAPDRFGRSAPLHDARVGKLCTAVTLCGSRLTGVPMSTL